MPPWRHHRGHGQFRERRACRSGYRDRWRQHILQGRHQARERASIKEHLLFRCRTSGGVWGLERGYCMMIGGTKDAVDRLDPIFRTLARGFGDIAHTPGGEGRDPSAEYGYIHAGPAGQVFRQNDPQWYRIWLDAGLRGRFWHFAGKGRYAAA
jgi:hypothetical protein